MKNTTEQSKSEPKVGGAGTGDVGFDELLGVLSSLLPPRTQYVQVVEKPQHTRNLFGPIEEIAGKKLQLLERNDQGDCLCLFEGRLGTNIVDVDNKDIAMPNNRQET